LGDSYFFSNYFIPVRAWELGLFNKLLGFPNFGFTEEIYGVWGIFKKGQKANLTKFGSQTMALANTLNGGTWIWVIYISGLG